MKRKTIKIIDKEMFCWNIVNFLWQRDNGAMTSTWFVKFNFFFSLQLSGIHKESWKMHFFYAWSKSNKTVARRIKFLFHVDCLIAKETVFWKIVIVRFISLVFTFSLVRVCFSLFFFNINVAYFYAESLNMASTWSLHSQSSPFFYPWRM